MVNVASDKVARTGDFLFRYMRARHLLNQRVERPLPAHELVALILRGKQEFDEIYIEPDSNPPVVLDGKANDFFAAIIKKNYSAMPSYEPQVLSGWRMYVLRDGPMPRSPAPLPTAADTTLSAR